MLGTAIDRESLRKFLLAFYTRVMKDEVLSPVFHEYIGDFPDDWSEHLLHVEAFWLTVTGIDHSYRGQAGMAHVGKGIETKHFDRWILLWTETSDQRLTKEQAALLQGLAKRMRLSVERMATSEPESFRAHALPKRFVRGEVNNNQQD